MKRLLWYGVLLVPLLFLAVFFFYPLISILGISLIPQGQLDMSAFTEVLTPYYRDILWFTLWQACVSTALTLLLVMPCAYVFTRYDFPGKSLLMSLATLPFVLPTVIVASAFSALLGRNGVVNDVLVALFDLEQAPIALERTLAIIFIVHVFYNYAIALRMISGYWANQSTRIEDAARTLGAYGWRLWLYVRLPMLRPAITAAALLVFIFTFTSFGVILILGGSQFATIEVAIYEETVNFNNLPVAASLSLVQIGIMVLMMLFYTRLQRRITSDLESTAAVVRSPRTQQERLIVGLNLLFMAVLLFSPLLALILRAFTDDGGFTVQYFTRLYDETNTTLLTVSPAQTALNSIGFALITMLIATVLGVLASYLLESDLRWLDPLFMIPLATSAVTLGFGFIIALDEPPLNLRTSWVLIPLAHTLVAIPFVVRSVLPALRSIPPHLRDSAGILGASPLRRWLFVELPLISRGLIVGATFAFTVSMGEFGASLFVARPESTTMPIAIFRFLGRPGALNYGQAMAMSVLLMLVCAVSFILIERVRTAGVGEF